MARCLTCGRRGCAAHGPDRAPSPRPAAEAPSPLPRVPGYRGGRLLGRGGFGTVFEAVSEGTGERAAVKVARLDVPEARAQLAREGAALRAIGPPATPALLATGCLPDGTPFLAMEMIEAPSLADRLSAVAGPLPSAEFAAAAGALLEALAAVHGAGYAHGDVKPENILLGSEPRRARLVDFGLSERLGAPSAARIDSLAGTAEYMAPEQCEGRCPDARSDVYAAGAVLFEMATGRPPFFGPASEVRHAHCNLRPPHPSSLAGIPAAVGAVILRCLAKPPAERFATASELWNALAAAIDLPPGPGPGLPHPLSAPPQTRLAPRRMVAVLYFESTLDPVAIQADAAPLGGTVAHASAGRYALVFDPADAEHPVRRALRAAHGAVARRLARHALVDLATVTAQARSGGATRYLTAAFARPDSYPRETDPPGVLATAAAIDVTPGVQCSPVPGREGIAICPADPPGADAPTAIGRGAIPLIGRDDLLAEIEALARGALGGGLPTLTAVLGGPGTGKSHLASVLATRLRSLEPAPVVLDVRARQSDEGSEGGAASALLRRLLDLPERAAPPADGGRTALLLALPAEMAEEAWPIAALVLGWIGPDAPELGGRAAAPGALAGATIRVLGSLLRWRAARNRLCILIDDADQAEGVALGAVEYAALAEAGAPIFACVMARPGFLAARPAWGRRAACSRTIQLGPLPPALAADLCRRLLSPADSVPAAAVELLVNRTQGIPLLLVELVRSLKAAGLIRKRAHGGAHYVATDMLEGLAATPVFDWLADSMLRSLPAELASHAYLVALLGDRVSPAETAGVIGELEAAGLGQAFPLDGAAATRRLVALGLVAVHGGERLSFQLPVVRDAVSCSAPEPLRRAVHEAAFRYHSSPLSAPDGERLPRLLRHAEASGRLEEAAALALRLAEAESARHAYLGAESLYTRALALQSEGHSPERLAALRGRGAMRYRLDRHDEAVADLAAARAVAQALGDRGAEMDCLLDEATALDWKGDFASSIARAREAAALARVPSPIQEARLALAGGRTAFREERWTEAAATLAAAAILAERAGDQGYETLVVSLLLLGHILPQLGRPAEAGAALARAGQLARSRGDDLHVLVVHLNERNLHVARGDVAAALRSQEETVRLGRELGGAGHEFYGEFNMAELLYQVADVPGAEVHVRRARDIEAQNPDVSPTQGLSVLLDARIRLLAGDLAGARRCLGEFRDGLARARAEGWHGANPAPSETVLADMVDLATRDASDDEWAQLLSRSASQSVEQEPIEVLEMRGLASLRAGRPEQARRALEDASSLAGRVPNLMAARLRLARASLRQA